MAIGKKKMVQMPGMPGGVQMVDLNQLKNLESIIDSKIKVVQLHKQLNFFHLTSE